ncbi:hypothetical protein SUGI_0094010 [Cryptomeria japonica]|nr:hypothetical protein SUGI_0094010 [Cryptomeria japonica]
MTCFAEASQTQRNIGCKFTSMNILDFASGVREPWRMAAEGGGGRRKADKSHQMKGRAENYHKKYFMPENCLQNCFTATLNKSKGMCFVPDEDAAKVEAFGIILSIQC